MRGAKDGVSSDQMGLEMVYVCVMPGCSFCFLFFRDFVYCPLLQSLCNSRINQSKIKEKVGKTSES